MTVRLIEGQVPYTGGTAIEITADKVINLLLRSEDNLLQVNQDNELYCDLQLANGITPSSAFPVGVTTGIVNANDGRPQNGLLLHYETTSGAYAQWLYAQDGYFYLDGGTGVFKKVYYAQDVDDAIQALADSLATVAFTGDYNDLINKPTIGDAVLTIQKNGTTIDTFTANATVDKTINVTVPTALSDLTNDVVNDGKLTIKKNNNTIAEFTANDATNVYANIDVPLVINNTTTIDSANSLSAAMGKELQDQINNINTIGRFLSLWNCTTGLPQTDPTVSPYTYHTGDYYVVGAVSTGTNYKPDGGSYTIGVASTTVETATVAVGDLYFYDGNTWSLKPFTGQTMPIDNVLSTTSTNAVENRVVTNALNDKADLVNSAVSGDLAGLDANGNITDSGIAPSDIVKTSGDQTIAGTKTFSTSPVVPNKTADATNTGTAIATEAQVYKKQDTLTTQTAYTSKGTSTKVATITTNTLGQVTGIIETNIAFPVTSVNGSTGVVTVNDIKVSAAAPSNPTEGMTWYDTTNDVLKVYNGSAWTAVGEQGDTKFFTIDNYNDVSQGQVVLDWYLAGKNPVVWNTGFMFSPKGLFFFKEDTGSSLEFVKINELETANSNYATTISGSYVSIEYSGTTVTRIFGSSLSNKGNPPYLGTGVDYAVPYTPEYDGSPATKKYVDDHAGITNDTTGTTTTVAKIWAGTEAEYTLITPAADTIYYVF